jgi:hypothetical protein
MIPTESGLARLRADLCLVVERDVRRRARRRRLWQLALVPALALSTASAAVAVIPTLGQPAPAGVRHNLTRLERIVSRAKDQNGHPLANMVAPNAGGLTVAARSGDQVLYTERHNGIRCAVQADARDRPQGWQCEDWSEGPGPHGINLISLGGGSTRDDNFASGRVIDPSARSVSIRVAGIRAPVTGKIGLDGYFLVRMPDSLVVSSPTGGDRPPRVVVTATAAAGRVVGRAVG